VVPWLNITEKNGLCEIGQTAPGLATKGYGDGYVTIKNCSKEKTMYGKKINWAGITQGKLTVIREVGKNKQGSILWECTCACGKSTVKASDILKRGVKSCGIVCGVVDANKARTAHGQTRNGKPTKPYWVWINIKNSANCQNFAQYNEEGIMVCNEWASSFKAFYAAVGEPPTSKHILRRIDSNLGYEPGNVRWATWKEHYQYTSTCITHNGKTRTLMQWAKYLGISYTTVFRRMKKGKPIEEVLAPKKHSRGANIA
jgi:hypothetical protein